MAKIDCQFPVLTISFEHVMEVKESRERLESCSARMADDRQYFPGLLLIDVTGRSWSVRSARKIRVLKPWRPWRPWTWVQVELDAVEGKRFDLEALQERMCQAVDADPHLWNSIEDVGETKAWFWSAPDIPSLIGQIRAMNDYS